MKKFYLYINEGDPCELRSLDATRICEYFKKNGYIQVDKPQKADIIFFIACASFKKVAEESMMKVKKFQSYDSRLIIGGCLPVLKKEELSKIFNGPIITPNNIDKIDELFTDNKVKIHDIKDGNTLYKNFQKPNIFKFLKKRILSIKSIQRFIEKTRAIFIRLVYKKNTFTTKMLMKKPIFYIRIANGCSGVCSYCSIKDGFGGLKSKPIGQCLNELKDGLKKGYTNFMLIADDAGIYGLDKNKSLPDLINELLKVNSDFELSILGISQKWLVKYCEELKKYVKNARLVSIGIPIQSFSKRILKSINRYDDVDEIKKSLLELKESCPDLSLHTHYLVGFPGETHEEFMYSLNCMMDLNFNVGVMLPYTSKTGRIGMDIEPKISKKEIYQRMNLAKKILKKNAYTIKYLNVIKRNLFFKEDYDFVFYKK